jgi:hypothetical protein
MCLELRIKNSVFKINASLYPHSTMPTPKKQGCLFCNHSIYKELRVKSKDTLRHHLPSNACP